MVISKMRLLKTYLSINWFLQFNNRLSKDDFSARHG